MKCVSDGIFHEEDQTRLSDFTFWRAITFSGAPFLGLGGDDFARPGTEVFIALLRAIKEEKAQ